MYTPRLVASSNSGISTADAGRWTYRTTLPRTNMFLTELCGLLMRSAPELQWETHQVRVLEIFDDNNVVQLDVEVLVHALECPSYRDVVLELDCDLLVDQRLEEAWDVNSKFFDCDIQDLPEEQHLEPR